MSEELENQEENLLEDEVAEKVELESTSSSATASVRKNKRFSSKKRYKEGYWRPFGTKQVADLLMIFGGLVTLIGIFIHVYLQNNVTIVIGLIMFLMAASLASLRCIRAITRKGISKKSPEYKRTVVNLVIVLVILAVSILGIVAAFIW